MKTTTKIEMEIRDDGKVFLVTTDIEGDTESSKAMLKDNINDALTYVTFMYGYDDSYDLFAEHEHE